MSVTYYILVFIIAIGLGVIVAKLYLSSKRAAANAAKITKNTKIGELLDLDPAYAKILTEQGMHCVGCPSARGETLEEAAAVHKMDLEKLLKALRG